VSRLEASRQLGDLVVQGVLIRNLALKTIKPENDRFRRPCANWFMWN